jgi:SLOG cluster2
MEPFGKCETRTATGLNVGISVSASDTWSEIGLTQEHQEDLAFNIALQLILLGAKVAWGGDLRPDGFGSQLRQIVQAYQAPNRPPQDHVAMTIPYSSGKDLKPQELAPRRAFADVRLMGSPLPAGEGPAGEADSQSPESRALAAVALSVMRMELAGQCDARVILGRGVAAVSRTLSWHRGRGPPHRANGPASVHPGRLWGSR